MHTDSLQLLPEMLDGLLDLLLDLLRLLLGKRSKDIGLDFDLVELL